MNKVSPFPRILVALASLLLAAVYFFPLWRIGLTAPQYPEGLFLDIWTNKITGDVRNINILNHYIGMSKIEPDKIKELAIFPLAFGLLIGSGIVCALLAWRRLIQIWCAALLGFAVLGLYDFYLWEYRYGHELSPDAIMQIEESYQPPLIGTKQLANITATSWPHYGGYAFTTSALLALLILLLSLKNKSGAKFDFQSTRQSFTNAALLALVLLGPQSCRASTDYEAIEMGRDACHECKMTISDLRFGGEAVTHKGKVYKFDSLDCLAAHYRSNQANIARVYVLRFSKPGEFVDAQRAVFADLPNQSGPMGTHLAAFASKNEAEQTMGQSEIAVSNWSELLQNNSG